MEASLALEDGRLFRGRAFGAPGERVGEIVFNTSMTGYQEILTDPSYRGQIVVMTCSHVGNYGTNALDQESRMPQVEGFAVREVSVMPSNWRANQGLPQYLREHGIPGISEIDTRALTRHIRTRGTMRAVISSIDRDAESLVRKARETAPIETLDLVARVTRSDDQDWELGRNRHFSTDLEPLPGGAAPLCVAYDFGIKHNILRLLRDHGFRVTVVPAQWSATKVLELAPDAVFLSNGPGDPTTPSYAVENVKALIGRVPIFGICLGHQITALALGARTFKMKFGHRGANHPVKDLRTGKVAVTSQNHGYAVDPETLPAAAELTHVNLNDMTCEGFVHRQARLLAVQYHPEASPGPHDALSLFREFREMAQTSSAGSRPAREDQE